MKGRFENKVVMVTGAAGDIGKAAALAFARAGASLALTDRREDVLKLSADEVRATGSRAESFACDQTDPAQVGAMFADVSKLFGRLDVLVACAGYGRYGLLLDLDYSEWRRHIDINLTGSFLVAQGAARLMSTGGSIVFIASTAAAHVADMFGAYSAAKSGLRMLSRTFAAELGSKRIRVNLLMPGVIETGMTKGILADVTVREDLMSETPAGRIGSPDDVAGLAAFLCSDEAGYVTGAEILIDGGQTLHGYPRWFSTDYSKSDSAWAIHAKRV